MIGPNKLENDEQQVEIVDPIDTHVNPIEIHIDPSEIKNGPIELHIDPNEIHNDPIEIHNDPIEIHNGPIEIDPIDNEDPIEIHFNPIDIDENELDFHLSSYIKNPYLHDLMTSLPNQERLQDLEKLSPTFRREIKECLIYVYSYVTEREFVEGTNTFFIHVATTSLWENVTGKLIKGKDHTQKIANVLLMLENRLTIITKTREQNSFLLKPEIKGIILSFEKLIESHIISLKTVLQRITPKKKQLLREVLHYDVDSNKPHKITPTKEETIRTFHPHIDITPNRLTGADIKSLNYLVPPHEREKKIQQMKKVNEAKKQLFLKGEIKNPKKQEKDLWNKASSEDSNSNTSSPIKEILNKKNMKKVNEAKKQLFPKGEIKNPKKQEKDLWNNASSEDSNSNTSSPIKEILNKKNMKKVNAPKTQKQLLSPEVEIEKPQKQDEKLINLWDPSSEDNSISPLKNNIINNTAWEDSFSSEELYFGCSSSEISPSKISPSKNEDDEFLSGLTSKFLTFSTINAPKGNNNKNEKPIKKAEKKKY